MAHEESWRSAARPLLINAKPLRHLPYVVTTHHDSHGGEATPPKMIAYGPGAGLATKIPRMPHASPARAMDVRSKAVLGFEHAKPFSLYAQPITLPAWP
jgi:hypothetical protein